MIRIFTITVLLAAFALTALADVPRPDTTPSKTPTQRKSIDATLDIKLDANAKDAKLIIPRSQISQLRAQLDQLDDDGNTAGITTGSNFGRLQTVVSGLFLSLAFIFGGVWFFRSGRGATRFGKGVGMVVVLTALASAASLVYANAGPPSSARSLTGKTFSESVQAWGFAYGKVKLEVGNDNEGSAIRLVVPDPPNRSKTEE